jgi:hypothetical protein
VKSGTSRLVSSLSSRRPLAFSAVRRICTGPAGASNVTCPPLRAAASLFSTVPRYSCSPVIACAVTLTCVTVSDASAADVAVGSQTNVTTALSTGPAAAPIHTVTKRARPASTRVPRASSASTTAAGVAALAGAAARAMSSVVYAQ